MGNVGSGIVEVLGRRVISGWVIPIDSHEKVLFKVNGSVIGSARPSTRVRFNGKRRNYGFSRRLRGLWQYLAKGDYVEVEYGGKRLPIVGFGFRYVRGPKGLSESKIPEMLKKMEEGYVFNKYGAFDLTIQKNDAWKQGISTLFERARTDIKNKFGYDLFPTYGTMLGAVREGDFIGHDNDFDSVYISRETSSEKVRQEFVDICEFLIDEGYSVFSKKTHIWVRVPDTKYKFDIFYSYFTPEGKYKLSYGYHGEELDRSNEFFELVDHKINDLTIQIPKNSEEMLGQIFGDDWRIPNPGFSHHAPSRRWDREYHLSVAQVSSLYWKQFYRDNPITGGSLFAQFVADRLGPASVIAELGCGTGRDSVYFAKQGYTITASDRSAEAIEQGRQSASGLNNIEFSLIDASIKEQVAGFLRDSFAPASDKSLSNSLKQASNRDRPDCSLLYMRFFLHAVTKEIQDVILDAAQENLPRDALIAMEFRTEKDKTEKHVYGRHYRRFIPMSEMVEELRSRGFSIEHAEEGRGLSPYEEEDPFLCRIISIKQ